MEEEETAEEKAEAAEPAVAFQPPSYPRSPARLAATDLLKQLVASPYPETQEPAPAAEPTLWQKIGLDRPLYVILSLALLLGLLFPVLTNPLQEEAIFAPGSTPSLASTEDLADLINTYTEDDIVMIAYEWDIQRRGDLAPLEHIVTRHLMERNAHMVLLSTDTQGTMLSFDLRDRLQQAGYSGKGIDYVLLGYRPGGELALRAIAQNLQAVMRSDFAGRDATQGALATDLATGEPRLKTIHDLSMIVVIANQTQDVRSWIEQVHRIAPQVPMVFLLPSETAPIVQPYLDQPGILHLVGKQGALAYEAQISTTSEGQAAIAAESGHYHFTVLIFLILTAAGVIIQAVIAKGNPPTTKGNKGEGGTM
jgi:hypothetical protein